MMLQLRSRATPAAVHRQPPQVRPELHRTAATLQPPHALSGPQGKAP